MKQAIAIGLCALLLPAPGSAAPAATKANPAKSAPPAHACDHLAGDPNDAARVAPGVPVREIDAAKALPACKEAIAAHPQSVRLQYHMGRVLHRMDDYTGALEWYRKAAARDYPPAMSILGVFYAAGGGVERDYDEAVRWYRKAAARGHFIAMHNLAIRHTDGKGATLDFNAAIGWFRKAAAAGYAASMEGLAYIYMQGREDVARDPEEAVRWLQKASEKGRFDAMYFLALAHDKGEGTARDGERAGHWFHRAIDTGSRLALFHIATGHAQLAPETRRAFQEKLKASGHFGGAADGVFGADTLAAAAGLGKGPHPPLP